MIRLMSVRKPASALDDREDVLLAHDEELVAVDLELGAGVFGVEDLVPLLDVHRLALPVIEDATGPSGEDLALLGLLLGGVRKDDPALGRLLTGGRLDDDSIAQRAKLGRRGSGGGQRAFLLVSAMAGRRHGLRASAGPWGLVSCRPTSLTCSGALRRAGSSVRPPVPPTAPTPRPRGAFSTLGVRVLSGDEPTHVTPVNSARA